MINWDDLKYLLATVQWGTYSLAARELGVNRTTVARRISTLEKQLGAALFEHTQDGYQLTEIGQQVLDSAQQLNREVGELESRVLKQEHQLTGALRVAAPLGLGPEFMPELADFSQAHPGIKLELINTVDPMASLNLRKADVGIGVSHQLPDYLSGHCVGELSRALYASKAYLKRNKANADFSQHLWVGWGKEMTNTLVAKWMQRNLPADVNIPIRVNSWHALREAVSGGMGVAHLWCFLAQGDKNLLRLRPPCAELAIDLWLFQHAEMPGNPRINAFMDTMQPALKARIGRKQ